MANSEELQAWLSARRELSKSSLNELVKIAREGNGELIHASVRDEDDYCGTMRLKPPGIGPVLGGLVERGYCVEVFPYGIPRIDEFIVKVFAGPGELVR